MIKLFVIIFFTFWLPVGFGIMYVITEKIPDTFQGFTGKVKIVCGVLGWPFLLGALIAITAMTIEEIKSIMENENGK